MSPAPSAPPAPPRPSPFPSSSSSMGGGFGMPRPARATTTTSRPSRLSGRRTAAYPPSERPAARIIRIDQRKFCAVSSAPTAGDCIALASPIALPDQRRTAAGRNSFLSLTTWSRCAMPATYNILIMGASYGSLLASKMLFGGHSIHLVCLPAEADLINAEGFRVRLPVKGRKDPVELDSRKLPGQGDGGRRRRRQPEGLRSRRARDAGAAIPLARRARTARCGGEVAGALHVDHEHAAAALCEAHPRPRTTMRSSPPTPTRASGTISIPARSRCAAPIRRRSGRRTRRSTC